MMKTRWIVFAAVTSALLAASPMARAQAVTLPSLLAEMTDPGAVARFPAPRFESLQASSYNRASTNRNQPDQTVTGWFADSDGLGFIRTEQINGRTEWVLMEHDGPGCITRIWTPFFYYGFHDEVGPNVRIYPDGSDTPVFDESLIKLVTAQGSVQPPFATYTARAGDLYLPIPFARSCQVTMAAKPFYDIINYRAYPAGTKVETFTRVGYEAAAADLEKTGIALTAQPETNQGAIQKSAQLQPGDKIEVPLPAGPNAIRQFTVRLPGASAQPASLRSTVLAMTFDSEETVWCPLGDFFCSADALHPIHTWQRTVTADGTMVCRWVMPYRSAATMRVLNLGAQPVEIALQADAARWAWDERSMHFHANWRPDDVVPGTPFQDWNYIDIRGQGVFVGDAWTVLNIQGSWWGEGDEKIYVDDAWDKGFPTHFGTGTEDYYGWAGGEVPTRQDEFSVPFLANARVGGLDGRTTGFNICTRTRSLDAIPFTQRLRFDMESSFGTDIRNPWNLLGYSAVTFWYARPGATHNRPPLPEMAARPIMSLAGVKAKADGIRTLPKGVSAIGAGGVIGCPADASANVKFAAREIRRYVYLRTGTLLPLAGMPPAGTAIVLKTDPALEKQEYRLKTDGPVLTISGGSDVGVLYGAYAFAEKLGVRFQIDGDVMPDARMPLVLPVLDETHQPLFELRGLQPFHDFPEGPDWWTLDDWKAVVSQAAKLRMNFIGLHTYPFQNKDLGPEPTVWIGLPEDVNADGTVKTSDYSSWYTTAKFQPYGCYRPEKTSAFSFGGAELFPSDNYGAEVNGPDDFPFPKTPVASVALIDRTGKMLRSVFDEAHRLGMKTCVGTESPLDIPDVVKARLKELGMKPEDPATLQKLYEGMFLRIQRAYPIDYYWIWGHEGEIHQARFITNLQCARAALKESKAPFGLGICGWGWITQNFLALDQALPKEVVFSAISMSVGNGPVSPNFGRLEGRQKWAIPWFEDDGGLSSPQLWVGRMRKDAVDARNYGCNGLMGLHWRTRILSPNISALAQAAWDQGDWSRPASRPETRQDIAVLGGKTATFFNNPITGSDDTLLYQSVRFDLQGYRFAMPNGLCRVTLRFCEPAYNAVGKRVFGVKLQGKVVIRGLDLFARVGQNKALDLAFGDIAVTNGELRVDFIPEVEFPCIAAIEVAGAGVTRKVNCGGPAYQDFAADPAPVSEPRFLAVQDFYEDWARAQFGAEVAAPIAEIFTRLDGRFPRASTWNQGPGVMIVNRQPWEQVAGQYRFVEEMTALSSNVRGAGNRERFDWWLNTFRYARAMAQVGCTRGALDHVMEQIKNQSNPQEQRRLARDQALPLREQMVQLLGEMYSYLLATLNNSSELGAVVNLEQQSLLRTQFLVAHDQRLEQLLGGPLPAATQPWKDYRGPARLVVMTRCSSSTHGEKLVLPILALDKHPVKSVVVKIRLLGQGGWRTVEAAHLARAVYRAKLPAATEDFEYFVETQTAGGQTLRWPATAPELNQTVVILE